MTRFSSCTLKSFLSLPLILLSISCLGEAVNYNEPSKTGPNLSLIMEQQKEVLEYLFAQTQDQLKMIDATTEDLASVVSNDIVTKIKDKGDHLTKLSIMREIISSLTSKTHLVITAESIHALIYTARSIANFLLDNIEDGFYKLEYFDLGYIHIPTPENNCITIEKLQQDLKDNNELINELDYRAANIGLSWHNKVYRSIRKRITRPWRKYRLGPTLGIGSAVALTGLLIWWQFDINFPDSLRDIKIPFTNKKILGPTPRFDVAGEPNAFYKNKNVIKADHEISKFIEKNKATDLKVYPINEKSISKSPNEISTNDTSIDNNQDNSQFNKCMADIGLMGSLERMIAGLFYSNQAPVTSKLSLAATSIGGKFIPDIIQWGLQKIKKADNFMMGGAYKNRSVGDVQYRSKINFDDVIGCHEAKRIGTELCMYLKDPERFDRAKLTPAKGYLLVGKTRTGKSFFVESLLGELQRNLGPTFGDFKICKISYADIESHGIKNILSAVKNFAPCILFIDEIDLLGLQRSQNRKRLSEFLTAMSGYLSEIDPDKAVIIIGATNKQESIDFALKQPGRFGVILPFERPSFSERKKYIKRELKKLAINIDQFDIDQLARESEGYVFEAIGLVIKKAMIRSKINNEPISQSILEQSFDETIRGILEDAKLIPEEQKDILASHMAGHTLANILLEPSLKVNKVTIQKVRSNIKKQTISPEENDKDEEKQKPTEYGKIFLNHERDSLEFESKDELIKQCKVMLAGHIAERIILGHCSYSYHSQDRQRALNIAQSIVIGGLKLDQLPKKIKDKYLTESYDLMETCEQEIEQLLMQNKDELNKVTQMLKEKGTLSIRDIKNLLNPQGNMTKKNTKNDTLSEIIEHQSAIKNKNNKQVN